MPNPEIPQHPKPEVPAEEEVRADLRMADLELARIEYGDPRFERAVDAEFTVFRLSGFLEPGDEEAGRIQGYDGYERSSVFNAAIAPDGSIVGVLREIRPDKDKGIHSFKTVNDFERMEDGLYPEGREVLEEIDPEKTLEIGTVATMPDFRGDGLGVSLRLYGMMVANSYAQGYEHWLASIDSGLLAAYKEHFGFIFDDIGPSVYYIGSHTTPVYGNRDKIIENLRVNKPQYYEQICLGHFPDGDVDYSLGG